MPLPPARPAYEITTIAEIPHSRSDASHGFQLVGEWKQIRHHFGILEFAANAFVATEPGQIIVHEHVEEANDDQSDVGDEELYFIHSGSATVVVNGESTDVGPGALIFIGDPKAVRSLTAKETGTTVLTFGTNPGVRFVISRFEQEISTPARWSVDGP